MGVIFQRFLLWVHHFKFLDGLRQKLVELVCRRRGGGARCLFAAWLLVGRFLVAGLARSFRDGDCGRFFETLKLRYLAQF